jgi:uncharacterized membrane protein
MTILLFARIAVALFFIYAGYAHFTKARFFYKITPPLLQQWKEPINVIVGVSEIAGGVGLLLPFSQAWAAWGIIALLIAVFPANIYMLTSKGAGRGINIWFLWLRLPLQFALIALVYQFT